MFSEIRKVLEENADKIQDTSAQSQIAERLNWALVKGEKAIEAKPILTLVTDADKAGAAVLEESEKYEKEKEQIRNHVKRFERFVGTSLVMQSQQVVCGEQHGQDVYIFPGSEGGGQNRPSRMKLDLVVLFKNRLGCSLHMYPEMWYSKVGKALFRLQDIHIGHEDVDNAFMIKASKPKVAQTLLRKPDVLSGLRGLLNHDFEPPIINDVAVRSTAWKPFDLDSILKQIDKLAMFGAAISKEQSGVC